MIKKPKKINFKKQAWDNFSKFIRKKNVCEFHLRLRMFGYSEPCRCSGVLQACHKISRSKLSVKFDERNVFSGCAGSNLWANYHQLEWDELWRKLWPEDVDYLAFESKKICRMSNWSYKIIADTYKEKSNDNHRSYNFRHYDRSLLRHEGD
jgi:hypothetical protein